MADGPWVPTAERRETKHQQIRIMGALIRAGQPNSGRIRLLWPTASLRGDVREPKPVLLTSEQLPWQFGAACGRQ